MSSPQQTERGIATVGVDVRRADGSTGQEAHILDEEAGEWTMCAFPAQGSVHGFADEEDRP